MGVLRKRGCAGICLNIGFPETQEPQHSVNRYASHGTGFHTHALRGLA